MWLNKPLWQLRFFFQCSPVLPSNIFQYHSSNTTVVFIQRFFTKKGVEKICKNSVKMFLSDCFLCNYDYLIISKYVMHHTQIYYDCPNIQIHSLLKQWQFSLLIPEMFINSQCNGRT